MEELIKKLDKLKENYCLKDRHIAILRALNSKDMIAENIAEITNIPKGRIYDFINELFNLGLIVKIKSNPAVFSIKNFESQIHNFLKKRFGQEIEKNARIYELLEEKQDVPKVSHFDGSDSYIEEVLKLFKESDLVRIICMKERTPFLLYPSNKEHFKLAREVINKKRKTFTGKGESAYSLYKGYLDFIKRGKSLVFLTDKVSINKHFKNIKQIGEKKFKKFLNELKDNLKNLNLKIFVVENPQYVNIIFTNKKSVINLASEKSTIGFVIESHGLAKIYEGLCEDYQNDGIPLQKYLKGVYL